MISPFLHIGLNEIVDIAFVTVLFYAVIVWIRRSRATAVLIGISILGAVYIVARQLDLELTASIFQGFIAIFLIVIVVIFQEELRQIFERIAVWSFVRKGGGLESEASDVLMRAVADFQKKRVGALIVVGGKVSLERHTSGGIELNGKISEPLLKSIFDPHSPGHDGAIIVEGDRILSFVVHLPLSKNFEQLREHGTRHAAALGLSELTDALCLVVSEETGGLSVARDGTLKAVRSPQEMGALLGEFLEQTHPQGNRKKLFFEFFRYNWVEKAVSVLLAVGLWYLFVPGSKEEAVSYQIPLRLENLPADLELEKIEPAAITATFTGPKRAFYLFDPEKLKVSIDTGLARYGRRTFQISENDVLHPKDLNLVAVNPSTVKISVRRLEDGNQKNDADSPTLQE